MDDLSELRMEKRRTSLLNDFRTWLSRTEPDDRVDELAANAETFLGWDINYAEAQLTQFDSVDVDEYLLDWCPRKLSFPPADWVGVVDGLVAYLEFLGSTKAWSGRPKQAEKVAVYAGSRIEDFLEAMANPANFGMAKGMFMGPAFSGADIDFSDAASLQAAVDRYNNLPFDERKAMTDPFMMGRPDREEVALRTARAAFKMPPVRMPNELAVMESAVASPLRIAVEGLREYVRPKGVALTSTLNFKLADCRALVELLQTGDRFEYGPEGFVNQVRSMNQLRRLAFIFDVAMLSGATQIVGSRIRASAEWPDDVVVAATELAATALDAETDLEIDGWLNSVGPTLAAGFPYLIAPALGFGVALAIDEMMPLAVGAALSQPRPIWLTEETAHTVVAGALRRLMETMQLAGVIILTDDTVAMTPFGVHFMVQYMREQGFAVTEQESVKTLTAEQLLDTITDATVLPALQTWQDWQPEWTEERRYTAIVDALLAVPYELRTAHQRFAAFELLSVSTSSGFELELRRLLGGPYSGYALTELAGRGVPVLDNATDDEMAELSDILAVMLPWVDKCYLDMTVDGVAAVIESVGELLEEHGTEVLQTLARLPVSEAAEVLGAVGSAFPSKSVAKLARTELHRWRSRWGH